MACDARGNQKLQHGRHVQVNFFEGAGKNQEPASKQEAIEQESVKERETASELESARPMDQGDFRGFNTPCWKIKKGRICFTTLRPRDSELAGGGGLIVNKFFMVIYTFTQAKFPRVKLKISNRYEQFSSNEN